ncbi:sensor domain-containing diguanylate cyclase [Sporosarcina sp. Te-1]|uniref:sensor domain-containing diguanylate cyclase n=1 Tax=Sporosarcina sp. Te-1 TaxID=2818390 RepID=UPI001A9CF7B1|nr:sensor domain-containing diguanylate cyclase [Sporosarcina sp. Te-1]QTD41015.1 GGDEF domain-containing protein [Sporosarcina sp. Te-1]
MDAQLNFAPCGYLVLTEDWHILDINQTLKEMLGIDNAPENMRDILTVPSKVYFQTYFVPVIHIHGRVEELYLTLKGKQGPLPVLMSARERNSRYECVLMQMSIRDEYENELLVAKRNAEQIQQETDKAYNTLLGLMNEVQEKQQELMDLNHRLQTMATTDPLTGLYNRRVFQERLAEQIEKAAEKHTVFSVLLFDIDYFKTVNDTYGHNVGDEVLKELAEKIKGQIPVQSTTARIGGEEFAIIQLEADQASSSAFAEKLRQHIATSIWRSKAITISIGIATYQEGDTAESMYIRADSALYTSKRSGRNRVARDTRQSMPR